MNRRHTQTDLARIELRGEAGKETHIEGYAVVFYDESDDATEYVLWGNYRERIMPGACDAAIQDKHDARGLFNHNSDKVLGRVSAGTCELTIDKKGLRYSIPIDHDDPDHVSAVCKLRRGDVTGSSFAFYDATSVWTEIENEGESVYIREITDIGKLHDVGPVTFPAYEATEAGVRTACFSKDDLVEARSLMETHRKKLYEYQQRIADQMEVDYWDAMNR